jgi:RNA 2',3'-cyclic 3'-phosphodiesterase
VEDVVHYLSGRGNFHTLPFLVGRFVLMSSKESVGGGPYLTEEIFPLQESRSSYAAHDYQAEKTLY